MMPLLLTWYVTSLDTEVGVPVKNIVETIGIMLLPVGIGMLVKSKGPKAAKILEKVGSISGILIILFLIVSVVRREAATFGSTGVNVYLSVAFLCFGGFALGYFGSRLVGLKSRQARTVSLETGIQNTPLTMPIILTSFAEEQHAEMLVLPIIYAISIVVYSCVATGVFRWVSVRENDAGGSEGEQAGEGA